MTKDKEKKRSLKINAVLNVIKQCSTVVFPLITYPYITRVLGTNNFGRVNFASSVVEYGIVFAALGIPSYVVREGAKVRGNEQEVNQMASEIFTISLFTMLLSMAAIGLLAVSVPKLRAEWVLIFILSFNIVFSILGRDWVNAIYEDYFYVTIRYLIFKAGSLILIFLFVKKPSHLVRYAAILLFSESGGYIANMFYSTRYIPFSITRHPHILKHLKPLLLLFCSTVAIRIYIQSDITILGFIRTDSEVGIYSLASKIYSVIKSVLNAIILVAIPRISYYIGNGKTDEYNELLRKLKDALITLLFPCIVGGIALSRNIVFLMGGEEYVGGYIAFEILCVALLFAVLGCFYAQGVLIPNKKEGVFFACTSIAAAINILLNCFVIRYLGIEGAALTTLAAECFILISCKHFSKGLFSDMKSGSSAFSIVIGCAAVFVMCKGIQLLELAVIVETLLSVVASVIVYGVVLLLLKNKLAISLLDQVLRMLRHR